LDNILSNFYNYLIHLIQGGGGAQN